MDKFNLQTKNPGAYAKDAGEAISGNFLAQAICAYVKHFDKHIETEDLVLGLPIKAGSFTGLYVPRALSRLGLSGYMRSLKSLKKAVFPICAFLEDGRYIIILSRENEYYKLQEPQAFDGVRDIVCEDIDRVFTGHVVIAAHAFEAIERKYLGETNKGHWFWSHFMEQKKLLSHVLIGTLVANLLAVGVSLFTLQVYDRVIPNHSEATLWVLCTGVFLAIVFEGLLKIARANLIDVTGREIEISASTWLFQRLQGMKLHKNKAGPGSLLYAVREFSSVREFFTTSSISSVADIPFVFIFVALIYFIAGPVVYVVLAAMVLIVVPSLLAQRKMVRLTDEMLGGTSAANKVLIEATYGQEAIKSLRAENHFQQQWEELLALNAEKMTEQRLLSAKLLYWSSSIQQAAYVAAVTAGTYFVFAGDLTLGAIIAISILTSRALSPVTNLSATLTRWQQVKAGLNMMENIADSEQDVTPGVSLSKAHSLAGHYQLENIQYTFEEGMRPALQIPNLTITAGKTIALLGANGSGKSTLLRLMSGLLEPTVGALTLDGLLVNKIAPWDLRRHVGYLPQEIRLFAGTLRENLEMVCGPKPDAILFKALAFAGLDLFVKSHPAGLDMSIADGGSGVSTGQKQSIGLARLYLQNPTIILLDEPTASFDQILEKKVIKNLKLWLQNRTCVLSTHRPALLELAEDIIVLQNGKIGMQGEATDVINKLSHNSAPDAQKRLASLTKKPVASPRKGREHLDALQDDLKNKLAASRQNKGQGRFFNKHKPDNKKSRKTATAKVRKHG